MMRRSHCYLGAVVVYDGQVGVCIGKVPGQPVELALADGSHATAPAAKLEPTKRVLVPFRLYETRGGGVCCEIEVRSDMNRLIGGFSISTEHRSLLNRQAKIDLVRAAIGIYSRSRFEGK